MDGISWSDLNEDEQSAIAMLAAGAPICATPSPS